MTQRIPSISSLFVLASLALGASAQETQQIEADTKFAEGLARRWQFVDLAEEVLEGVEQKYDLNSTQTEKLGLVRCEVYATAARRERDPEERKRLYTEALKAYRDFIEGNSYSPLLGEAEAAWVQLANTYAGVLELELGDLVGDEAEAVRTEIRTTLEDPLSRTGALIDNLRAVDEPTEADKRDLAALMLDRGRMLATMGRVSDDGSFYFGQAKGVFEDITAEYGEMTGWGLQAFLEYARVLGDEGQWADARDFYQFVVDAVMLPNLDDWEETKKQLSQGEIDWFWAFTEFSVPGLLEAAMASGDTEMATQYALRFWNRYKLDSFQLSLPRGYLALLGAAETLLDAGGYVGGRLAGGDLAWFESEEAMSDAVSSRRDQRSAVDMALVMAQTVNEDNKGNTLQTRAQKLISKIIESPGVELGPELLFEAASGHYADRNYAEAILGLKRTMASLQNQDDATRAEFGAKVLNKLGRAYANENRYLEAAMTFREGVTTWSGDPVYDGQNSKDMLAATTQLRSRTAGDPMINNLFIEAENFVTKYGSEGGIGEIIFRQAKRLYDEKDFVGAKAKFAEVPEDSPSYEKALVYMGASDYRDGNEAAARSAFQDYLENYLTDPARIADSSETILANRREAKALATYYLGRIADKAGDVEETLKYLANFHKEFPGQDQMAPNTLYMSLLAYLEKQDVQGARKQYDVLIEDYPDHPRTGASATRVYKAVSDLHEAALEGSAERAALLQAQAELMQTSNRLDKDPSYSDLRRESSHWMELGNWAEAERVLRKTSKRFADDAATRKGWHMNVQPDLGLVLLEQDKRPEALEVLRPLIPGAKAETGLNDAEFKPYATTVDNFFRAAVGEVRGDTASTMVEVVGAGTQEDVLRAAEWMEVLSRTKEKFTADWYDLKLNQIFAWRRAGQTDSERMNIAKDLMQTMRTDVDANFDGIKTDYEREGRDGDVAQARWRWLSKELN